MPAILTARVETITADEQNGHGACRVRFFFTCPSLRPAIPVLGVYTYMIVCKPVICQFSVALLIMTLGCKKPQQPKSERTFASTACSSLAEYFPKPNSGNGELFFGSDQAEWERNYLQHMQEPPLYACGSQFDTQPVYRFLWDRSLSKPIAVRVVVHPNGAGTLYVRELAHCCMIPPPKRGEKAQTWDEWLTLDTEKEVELSIDQTQPITTQFQTVFHHPFDPRPIGNTTDGSDWIFESRVDRRYRLRDFRNIPPESARNLGLFLVRDLAAVPIQQSEIY